MSTADPFLPAQPADHPDDGDRHETAAADADVAAEDDLLEARTAQQKDPPFRTPEAGDRLSPEDAEENG